MRFPVFLLGLLISSFATGAFFWMAGAAISISFAWALGVFFAGQVLYVVLIGILAKEEEKSSEERAPERKTLDPSVPVRGARLAARHDQQG